MRFTFLNRLHIRLSHILLAVLSAMLIVYACDSSAATQATNYKHEVGISGQVITNPTAATFLTVPPGAEHAQFTVWGADLCYGHNVDGTAPTATNSARWLAGTTVVLQNDPLMLKRMRVINCTGSAATVQVYYSRSRRVGDAQ